MNLVLEIEYLTGICFAAIGPDGAAPDWPPQPDRVYSALVAAWATRGQNDEEARALEWLEELPAPMIVASNAEPRTEASVFVPPNDPRSSKLKSAKGVLPALRSRQPRRFPAARPHEPVYRLLWANVGVDDTVLDALQRLARDVAYVGHSSSLTRCQFLLQRDVTEFSETQVKAPERSVYPGRLSELRRDFDARRRPQPGMRVQQVPEAPAQQANLFGQRWLLLEHVAGAMPDLRSSASVAKTIRDALLSGYQRLGLGCEIPEIVSGHASDGRPTRRHHLAVVPLPFVGFPHADGHVMGFALIPPHDTELLEDQHFRRLLRELAPFDSDRGRRLLRVSTRSGTPSDRAFSIDVSPTFEPPTAKRSLDPALYIRSARTFATITPIALDRHLKTNGAARQEEIAAQIIAACRNIGLPEPEAIVPSKHSAMEGVPSTYTVRKAPPWMRWRLPRSLMSRQITHAVIRFPRPVAGPVILGAGRFVGMGLCRPLELDT